MIDIHSYLVTGQPLAEALDPLMHDAKGVLGPFSFPCLSLVKQTFMVRVDVMVFFWFVPQTMTNASVHGF